MTLRLIIAVLMILTSLVVLESARYDVEVTRFQVGDTPVARYAKTGADGPVVVMAHGFAGSQQMMQGYALPLARAGYQVHAFDFLGHGRNTVPMSGDVTSVDGTTRLLVEQTNNVIDLASSDNGLVAVLGHSMATDILVRVAATRDDIGPVVLISAFSQAIDATTPRDMLLVSGAWEPGLRSFAEESLQKVEPSATEGDTVTSGVVSRRASVAPFSEHVSVLQSRVARREALAWLDRAYSRVSDTAILPTGWAILGVLAGLVMIFRPLCALLPKQILPNQRLSNSRTALTILVPMVLAPLCALVLDTNILPVLVADYLVLHMLVFGVVQLALLRMWGICVGPLVLPALGLLALVCAVFGIALDRYAANFWPTPGRFGIITAMMIGTVPYMLSDAVLTVNQTGVGRILSRTGFLASLAIAVALEFEELFFLILIAPVLVLFYLVFGTMGRAAAIHSGPLSSGVALGVVLAWALGVSFPLFQA